MEATELFRNILETLSGEHNHVINVSKDDEGTTIYTAKIPKKVIGRVLGKNGRTADAVRYIMQCIYRAKNERVYVNYLELEGIDEHISED